MVCSSASLNHLAEATGKKTTVRQRAGPPVFGQGCSAQRLSRGYQSHKVETSLLVEWVA